MDYSLVKDSRFLCQISVDTGLITEMQIFIEEKQVLFMYTEQVVLQPEETTDKMYAGREVIRQLFREGSFVPYDYLEELFAKAFVDTDADI